DALPILSLGPKCFLRSDLGAQRIIRPNLKIIYVSWATTTCVMVIRRTVYRTDFRDQPAAHETNHIVNSNQSVVCFIAVLVVCRFEVEPARLYFEKFIRTGSNEEHSHPDRYVFY